MPRCDLAARCALTRLAQVCTFQAKVPLDCSPGAHRAESSQPQSCSPAVHRRCCPPLPAQCTAQSAASPLAPLTRVGLVAGEGDVQLCLGRQVEGAADGLREVLEPLLAGRDGEGVGGAAKGHVHDGGRGGQRVLDPWRRERGPPVRQPPAAPLALLLAPAMSRCMPRHSTRMESSRCVQRPLRVLVHSLCDGCALRAPAPGVLQLPPARAERRAGHAAVRWRSMLLRASG